MDLGCLPVSVAVPVVPTSKALVLATPITFALRLGYFFVDHLI